MSDHGRWMERVLALEHLEGPERAETEAHLATCASCRAARERLLELEGRARPEGELAMHAPAPAGDAAREAERASLEALVARAAARGAGGRAKPDAKAAGSPPAGRVTRFPRWALVGVPAAAAAALLVVFWPRSGAQNVVVRDAVVERASGTRGGGSGFHTGDAIVLHATLERAGVPIVVHVGPDGVATLLLPPPGATPRERPAGRLTLPDPAGGSVWPLEGPGGTETFLVAAAPARGLDPAALRRALAGVGGGATGRAARVAAVRAWMERRFGPPAETAVAHEP